MPPSVGIVKRRPHSRSSRRPNDTGGWTEPGDTGPVVPTFPTGTTEHWTSAVAHGLVEELFRRRRTLAAGFVLVIGLILAAVGLRMWADVGPQPVETIDHGATSGPVPAPDTGPPGTWQRWEEVPREPVAFGRAAEPNGSTITTFGQSMSLTVSSRTGDRLSPETP